MKDEWNLAKPTPKKTNFSQFFRSGLPPSPTLAPNDPSHFFLVLPAFAAFFAFAADAFFGFLA
jgi:hypothetical protein